MPSVRLLVGFGSDQVDDVGRQCCGRFVLYSTIGVNKKSRCCSPMNVCTLP